MRPRECDRRLGQVGTFALLTAPAVDARCPLRPGQPCTLCQLDVTGPGLPARLPGHVR
ncbi:DUF6767 domain-containing protein [Catellatospora bangladeshensis]|uniref:DUF6767 domain-containing protein n=1 Tax=Catellatospora bangladeshensis TaxID=310355 RepID=UPI00361786D5